MTLIERAHEFATAKHKGQRHGNRPYIVHCQEVAAILLRFGHVRPAFIAGGLLHDTVEDCGVTKEELHELFGEEVANIVWAVSHDPGCEDRAACWATIWPKLHALPDAVLVKQADRLANIEATLPHYSPQPTHAVKFFERYKNEHPAFVEKIGHLGDARMWHAMECLFADRR